MSSFRNYSDAGSYRTRSGIAGGGNAFGRSTPTGGSFGTYRNNYTGIGSVSMKTTPTKERSIGVSYANRGTEKERSTPISTSGNKVSTGDSRPTSRCSSRASTSSYLGSSNSYSEYGKEPLAYRGLRAASVEPCGTKTGAYRVTYSRTPTFGRSAHSPSAVESISSGSSATLPRYTGSSTSARYSLPARSNPERLTTSIGYAGPENFHSPVAKAPASPAPPPHDDIPSKAQQQRDESPSEGKKDDNNSNGQHNGNEDDDVMVICVVTRGTSPTPPPALTAFTRTRRLEPIPKPVRREVRRSEYSKKIVQEQEQQTERSDDSSTCRESRYSRYSGANSRVPWVSSYLEKFTGSPSSGPYAASPPRASFGNRGYGYSSKDSSSSRSTPSSTHEQHGDQQQRSRSSSSSGPSRASASRAPSPKVASQSEGRSSSSRERSPRVPEGQDRRESLSRASDTSGSCASASSKPGSVSRSGSLKSAVGVPTGGSLRSAGGKLASSSSSSSSLANNSGSGGAAPVTKIKSAGTTTTTTSSSSNVSSCGTSSGLPSSISGGKCGASLIPAGPASVGSRQAAPSDARKPPVPKIPEMVGKNAVTAATANNSSGKYVNKDFRKSALNMENGDPSRSQVAERKQHKKCQRSVSASSQDSQSEASIRSSNRSSPSPTKSTPRTPSSSPSNKSSKGDQKSSGIDVRRRSTCSQSPSPGKNKPTRSPVSTSECSSSESSNDNSEEEGEEIGESKPGVKRARSRAQVSRCSSRTSVLVSSADELSADSRPPKPPPSPRASGNKSSGGSQEETKSFLARALGPVAGLFKSQESGPEIGNGGWADVGSEEHSDSGRNNDSRGPGSAERKRSARYQSSEEKPWWLDPNSDNVPEGVDKHTNDDVSQDTTVSTTLPDDGNFKFKVWRQESGERAWWLDDNDDNNNIPEDEPSIGCPNNSSGHKGSSRCSSKSQRAERANRLRHQQSGERAWWMTDDPDNVPEGVEVIPVSSSAREEPAGEVPIGKRIRHIESGEEPWWMMDDASSAPDGVRLLPPEPASTSDSSESFERLEIGLPTTDLLARFPVEDQPLGHRASPEGVRLFQIESPPEPPDRSSPYDNVSSEAVPSPRQTPPRRSAPRKRPANLPLFIGAHTNIDDLLGDEDDLSHTTDTSSAGSTKRQQRDLPDRVKKDEEVCEEIDATQVIIHDSTPQTPVIKRRHRDADWPQPDGYIPEAVPFSTPWGQLDARKAKSPCAQYVDVPADENGQTVTEGRVNGEDDCLYLNINVPVVARYRPRGMPVVFFIHGGSFQYGSGSSFAENNIYMMDRDVVFVSINYRLGVQGFLSTEDEVLPGNLGLKDQSLALQWTADNIGHFGGDPRKITLMGFSAGGSSVQYHYLSPRSRGLFHSGVAISGAVFNPWGFTTHAAEKARKLGAIFNCPTHDSRPMVDCLKKVPAQDLAAATKHFQYWQYMPEAPFAPVVETSGPRPFIDKSPEDVAEAGELYDVPIVFSIVSEEGCDPGSAYAPHDNLLKQLNDNWTEIAPHLLEYNYTLPEEVHERVALAARRKYFGDGDIDNNSTRQLIRLLTDEQYSIGIEKSLRVQAEESTSPVYFYYYSYRGSSSRSEHLSHTKNNYGVCHCDDVLMVVSNSQPGNKTKEELAMIDLLLDVWETVAKDGVPKLGVEWRPVNTSNPEIEYMHIRGPEDYGMSGSVNFGNKYFWNEFFDLF